MTIRLSQHFPERFEQKDRYCPICGDLVKKESPTHRCSEEKLKRIEAGRKGAETRLEREGIRETPRSMDDKLKEVKTLLDPEFTNFDEEGIV